MDVRSQVQRKPVFASDEAARKRRFRQINIGWLRFARTIMLWSFVLSIFLALAYVVRSLQYIGNDAQGAIIFAVVIAVAVLSCAIEFAVYKCADALVILTETLQQ